MSRRRREARKVVARAASASPPAAPAPAATARYLAHDGALLRPVEDVGPVEWFGEPEPLPRPNLSTLTVAQLRARAVELGVSLGKARTKAAIIEALGG